MPLYRYKAVDAAGQSVTGTMDEASARRVTAMLEEKGLQVNSVAPAVSGSRFGLGRARLTWEDVEFLNSQFIGLTRCGLPIAPALEAIGRELRRGSLKMVVDDIRTALQSGSSLSQALEEHAGTLPPVYIAAVRAGEATGNLPEILELCAGYTADMVTLKSRLREAMTYPVVVLVFTVMMLVYLLTYTIPQFAEVFKDFGANLPALTLFWIDVSNFVRDNFGFVAVAICGVTVLFTAMGRTKRGRYALDWMRLRILGIGSTFHSASMARFCRSLGVLLSGKAPLDTSIELASATCGNAVLEAAALDAMESVRSGTRLALAFEMTGYFSGLFCWLVQVSDERGKTHEAFIELAENYEESFSRYSRAMLSVLTPAILFVLALIVMSVILGLYLPVFSLADAISGQ